MIKLLKKYQVQLTPFEAIKNWAINNINNDNLLLTEITQSHDPDYSLALEFIDYGDGSGVPTDNYFCNIALEQQGTDLAIIEDGLKVIGSFFPDIDPINVDGTYKRLIYHQIRTMFYNIYYDPTKIWGTENIDFEISKTLRILSDQFRLFDIPKNIFGDKITPKSITMYDNTLDNFYTVTDDGNGNLFAGINLFSKQQEIGKYENEFISDISSSCCDWYWEKSSTNIYNEPASLTIEFDGGIQESNEKIVTTTDTASLSIGFTSGFNLDYPIYEFSSITLEFYTGSNEDSVKIVTASFDTSSLEIAFITGNNLNTVETVTASFDTSSLEIAFITGDILNVVETVTASFDTSSLELAFITGSQDITAYVTWENCWDTSSLELTFIIGSNN